MAESIVGSGVPAEGTPTAGDFIEPSFWNALPHFLPLAIFPLIFNAAVFGGWWFVAPFIFFMLAGPLDIALGVDERNMDPARTSERRLLWHNLPVWAWAFLWPVTLAFGLWQILVADHFASWEAALMVLVLAVEAQAVFIVGHELIHRRSVWERRVGEFLLASASYPHYATEHVYIHHALVGTPFDVGSAPKGQGLWQYFPREVVSNIFGAWRVARERLARRGLPIWHHTNPFWRYGLETAFWYLLIYWMGGPWAILVFAILCLGVVLSMKISNYIQHYGLRRVRLPNGRFERVQPRHSWSANCRFSNWMFYNMQRHPDHHAVASRHYSLLQHYGEDKSPQLPGSYAKMFNLAVRPRRWFETMDPLVDRWRAHFYPEIDDWSAYDSAVSAARPEAFDAIVEIFGAAPRLARRMERNPELLDTLQEREFTDLDLPAGFGPDPASEVIARRGLTRIYWTRELGVPEMREQIVELPFQDASDAVEVVRNWSNDKTFQVGVHTLRGNLSPIEAETALSHVAEASVTAVLDIIHDEFSDQRGPGAGGLAAVALGDLASREVTPGHRLNVLFVYEGGRPEYYDALCRRFAKAFLVLSSNSLLFAPIANGVNEPPVRSIAEFIGHCRTGASSGELLDLMRTRCLLEAGDSGLGRRFDEARREVVSDASVRGKLSEELRQAIGNPDASSLTSVIVGRGGFRDVERCAQWLRLQHFGEVSDHAVITASVFEMAGEHGWVTDESAKQLVEAAVMWRTLRGALRLATESDAEIESLGSGAKAVLARSCGADDFEGLMKAIAATAGRAARAIDDLRGTGVSEPAGDATKDSPARS